MPVWLILKGVAIVIMSWYHAKTALLVLMIDLGCVPILLALKVLYKVIVSMIQLIIFKLTLKSSFLLINILIYADKTTFIIKYIIILLNLITFLNHCICRILILSLKYLFYFMSYYIVFFYLI